MKKYKHNLNDYKVIMHILRHHCDRLRQAEDAVEVVTKISGFPEDKVREIVSEMFYEGEE